MGWPIIRVGRLRMFPPENSPDASCQQLTSFACLSIMKGEANRLGFRLNQIQWYRPPFVLFSTMKFPANPPWNLPGPACVWGLSRSTFLGFAVLSAAPVQLLSFYFPLAPVRTVVLLWFDLIITGKYLLVNTKFTIFFWKIILRTFHRLPNRKTALLPPAVDPSLPRK